MLDMPEKVQAALLFRSLYLRQRIDQSFYLLFALARVVAHWLHALIRVDLLTVSIMDHLFNWDWEEKVSIVTSLAVAH